MNLSAVTVEMRALHLDPILDEGWHEHVFAVTAWRKSEPWTDGRSMREALGELLRTLAPEGEDGRRRLPPELWSNEAIAQACLILMNAVKIQVERPGFAAIAERGSGA